MRTRTTWIILLALVPLGSGRALGETPAERLERLGEAIRSTQVTILVGRDGGQAARFRGTALRREGASLTILTAAHCFEPDDVGREVVLTRDGARGTGVVERVERNPAYEANRDRDSPGADNEVAVLRLGVEGDDAPLFRGLATARVSGAAVPDQEGVPVAALTIDQTDEVRVVRAVNFSNPLWLEWGSTYRPIPGDSGGGLFAFARGPDGSPSPILIGVVAVRSNLGGGASIVHRGQSWLRDALARHPAP